jgi:hypothetical protein
MRLSKAADTGTDRLGCLHPWLASIANYHPFVLGGASAPGMRETQPFGRSGRNFSEAMLLLTRRFKEVLMTMRRNPR